MSISQRFGVYHKYLLKKTKLSFFIFSKKIKVKKAKIKFDQKISKKRRNNNILLIKQKINKWSSVFQKWNRVYPKCFRVYQKGFVVY